MNFFSILTFKMVILELFIFKTPLNHKKIKISDIKKKILIKKHIINF